jgi:hypothetical protein
MLLVKKCALLFLCQTTSVDLVHVHHAHLKIIISQYTPTFAGSQGGDEDRRTMPVVISPSISAIQSGLLDILCVHQGQRRGSVESERAFGCNMMMDT